VCSSDLSLLPWQQHLPTARMSMMTRRSFFGRWRRDLPTTLQAERWTHKRSRNHWSVRSDPSNGRSVDEPPLSTNYAVEEGLRNDAAGSTGRRSGAWGCINDGPGQGREELEEACALGYGACTNNCHKRALGSSCVRCCQRKNLACKLAGDYEFEACSK